MIMVVDVGSQAPDFTLNDYNKEKVSLSDFMGRKAVLLVFYPFAFSGICTGELCGVRDEIDTYQNDSVQVLGVSVDTPFSLKAWAVQEGYTFPLLSDFWPHGEVAKAYGVFNTDAGMAVRGTFLIDTEGVVRFAEVHGPGEARDQAGWKKALRALDG
jgi:mycoredoxin-dependent peroxiredoxin